jgi:sugar/nucleoside kinase (ribokinase family)
MHDLLVVGEINADLILSDERIEPQAGKEILIRDAILTMGASSVIAAAGAARLGLDTAFYGLVGDDVLGRFMLDEMRGRAVDISHVVPDPTLRTGLGVCLSTPRDRAIITFPGSISAMCAEQVPEQLISQAKHLHVAAFFLQDNLRPGLPRLLSQAQQAGMTTSLDPGWDPRGEWFRELERVIDHVDILLPNETEAAHLSGIEDPEDALEWLAERVPTVAIKLGAEGAIGARGTDRARAPVVPVNPVDTTGAGDSFNAGFLYGHIHGWTLESSLRLGCACGSLSTRGLGGTTTQPTLDEAVDAAGLAG